MRSDDDLEPVSPALRERLAPGGTFVTKVRES